MRRDRLSILLREKCERLDLTYEAASIEMGEPPNSVARWVSLSVLPGPAKYATIAEFLGCSVFEVGGALALDQVERYERGLTR